MGAALNYVWPTWELFLTFQNWLEKASFVKHFLRIHPKGLSPSKTNLHFFPCTFVISMFYPSFEAFCSENLVWKVHTGLHLAASRIDWTSSQGICHKGSQPLMVPAIILTFLLSAWTRAFTFLDYFEGCILCTLLGCRVLSPWGAVGLLLLNSQMVDPLNKRNF